MDGIRQEGMLSPTGGMGPGGGEPGPAVLCAGRRVGRGDGPYVEQRINGYVHLLPT